MVYIILYLVIRKIDIDSYFRPYAGMLRRTSCRSICGSIGIALCRKWVYNNFFSVWLLEIN